MFRYATAIVFALVVCCASSPAEAQVRDSISRKSQAEKGFFDAKKSMPQRSMSTRSWTRSGRWAR